MRLLGIDFNGGKETKSRKAMGSGIVGPIFPGTKKKLKG